MDNQTLLVRRLVAAGAVVLVLVLLVVLVKGCVDNRHEAALKDYNRSVRTLVEQSRSEVAQAVLRGAQRRMRRRVDAGAGDDQPAARRRRRGARPGASGSTRPAR